LVKPSEDHETFIKMITNSKELITNLSGSLDGKRVLGLGT